MHMHRTRSRYFLRIILLPIWSRTSWSSNRFHFLTSRCWFSPVMRPNQSGMRWARTASSSAAWCWSWSMCESTCCCGSSLGHKPATNSRCSSSVSWRRIWRPSVGLKTNSIDITAFLTHRRRLASGDVWRRGLARARGPAPSFLLPPFLPPTLTDRAVGVSNIRPVLGSCGNCSGMIRYDACHCQNP